MTLRTVRVPAAHEAIFARAEHVVSRYFAARHDDAERGTIEIAGERYVLVRAASLSVEFFELVRGLYGVGRESEADEFARNILFDLAHAVGAADARTFHAKMGVVDPLERVSAGPIHFAHSGWAFVDISEESSPSPDENFCLLYDHPYSFEADAWMRAGRLASFPVCIMNAGYSSGWCEESFGLTLVSSEVLCRARGDEHCRFVMAPPDRLEARVARYVDARPELALRVAGYAVPDFFARKRVEDELRQRFADELRERAEAEARLREAQKLEAVGRLAGGVAHDFNNLMSVVAIRVEQLAGKLDDGDPIRGELDQIALAAQKAATLTHQLLAFSRSQVLRPELLDLDAVLDETLTLVAPLLGEGVRVVRGRSEHVPWVSVDRSQIEQVLMNLAVNARDAMPEGGVLEARTRLVRIEREQATAERPAGAWVELTMQDTGVGMDASARARAFEPFFTTKPEGQGAGLGLATVYGIVTQSGGFVSVTSAPGQGTSFVVLLPHAEAASERAPRAREAGEPTGHRAIRMLLVDDDDLVLDTLSLALRNAGLDVLVAPGPLEALDIVASRAAELDIVLTDFVMPRMNGGVLAEKIRTFDVGLPVIVMSGYVPDPQALDGLALAAVLQKPFRADEAVAILEKAARRPTA